MTFGRYLRLSSTLLILTGFSSILITGTYLFAVGAGILVTLLHAAFGERLLRMLPVPKPIWNVVAILLFVYLFYESFFGDQDLVGNGIKFVVYLQIVKLLSPKTSRDWAQIYALSYFHLLAATVITSDLSFALPFLVYVVLACWTLSLFNLRAQQEDAVKFEHRASADKQLLRSRSIITRKYLLATSVLTVALLAVALLIFFSFPRVSMGKFLLRVKTHQRVSGFSEKIELGTIGTIKTNNTVVFRAEVDEQALKKVNIEELYWRGTATDFFDGRQWSQSRPDRRRIRVDVDTGSLNIDAARFPGAQKLAYKVFLEALSTPLIFGADRLLHLRWEKNFAERIFRGSISLEKNWHYGSYRFRSARNFFSDLIYHAESIIGEPHPDLLRLAQDPIPYRIRLYYLQLPDLDPQVKVLLDEIPLPDASRFDRAMAIQRFLEENYEYTLDVQDVGVKDPLRFFFLERKKVHCEYFSSALIVALRYHGIPARQVVGFRGGNLNPYGQYIAVRQRDAHSWVEVFFPKLGWIRFDPSPPDSTVRSITEHFPQIAQFFDYLRLRWNKYIVEYDLQSQVSLFERMGRNVSRLVRRNSSGMERDRTERNLSQQLSKIPKEDIWKILGGILILAGSIYLLRWTLRRRTRRRGSSRFQEVLRVAAAFGHRKESHITAEEWAREVEADEDRLPCLEHLTQLYYRERFGGISPRFDEWSRLLDEFKQTLRQRQKPRRKKAA